MPAPLGPTTRASSREHSLHRGQRPWLLRPGGADLAGASHWLPALLAPLPGSGTPVGCCLTLAPSPAPLPTYNSALALTLCEGMHLMSFPVASVARMTAPLPRLPPYLTPPSPESPNAPEGVAGKELAPLLKGEGRALSPSHHSVETRVTLHPNL